MIALFRLSALSRISQIIEISGALHPMVDSERDAILGKIAKWHDKGAKILLRRGTSGRDRVKVVMGPFGLFTKRFDVASDTYEEIKALIANDSNSNH